MAWTHTDAERQPIKITAKEAQWIERERRTIGSTYTRSAMKCADGYWYETTGCTLKTCHEFRQKIKHKITHLPEQNKLL